MRRMLQGVLVFILATAGLKAEQRIIVRVLGGPVVVNTTCLLLGCDVVRGLGDPLSQLFVLSIPDTLNVGRFVSTLLSFTGIVHAEVDTKAAIADTRPAIPADLADNQ